MDMSTNGRAKHVALGNLRIDGETQCRVSINEDTVSDYAEQIEASGEWPFPPLVVFHDGTDNLLADGFHRLLAARRAKLEEVPCKIHQGTAADARIFGMTANDQHGLRMTRADKRACVEWLLDNGGRMTREEVARLAGVTSRTVSQVVADRNPESLDGKATPPKQDSKVKTSPSTPSSGGNEQKPEATPTIPTPEASQDDPATEPQPAAPTGSIVLDGVGRPVPASNRNQHAAAAAIQAEARKLDAILRQLKELAAEPGGEFLELADLEIRLKEIKGIIFGCCYWSECPRCEGMVGKPCQACEWHGWWPASKRGHLSAADKQWLGVE